MTSRSLTPLLRKETRALLPTAAAANMAMLLRIAGPHSWYGGDLTMLAYVFGSLALGAQSIGHEYGYRTLGILLAQPSDRRRLTIPIPNVSPFNEIFQSLAHNPQAPGIVPARTG